MGLWNNFSIYLFSFIFHTMLYNAIFADTPAHRHRLCSNPSKFTTCTKNRIYQETTSKLIKDVVNLHFPECYGVQIALDPENNPTYYFNPENWDIPSMQVKFRYTIRIFKQEHGTSNLLRFCRQCIVYEVILNGASHPDSLVNDVFLQPASQKRAQDSYIFVNEYRRFQAAKKFLIEPKLKSYPNRVWPDMVPLDYYNPDQNAQQYFGAIFNRFCYYCDAGQPGILTKPKVYQNAMEIKSIQEMFPDVTNNLNGHNLRVTAPPAPPLVLIQPSKMDPKRNEIHGQQRNILYGTASKYNFTCSMYSVPGGSTGKKLPNGTWEGVMGEILYGRADLGLSVATNYDRREVADFTVSSFYAFLVLVSTKPIPVFEWQSLFYPFRTSAWFALSVTTALTLYLYKYLHNHSILLEIPSRQTWKSKLVMLQTIQSEIISTFTAFYMTVGSLLEQGLPVNYNTIPSRVIASFWMLITLIITCAYRSKLFSFLISPTIETPPSSFKDLSETDYTWGMKSLGGVAHLFITQSPLQYIRYIGENMEIYTDKYGCLDKTFYGKFTCIIYKAYIDYMMEVRYWKLKHQFHVSDFVTPPVGSAWSLARFSPLKRNFDFMSYQIYEMGLADKYLSDYQTSFARIARAQAQASNETENLFVINTNFKNDDETGPNPLQMANLYGGFLILGMGIAISAVFFAFEIFKHQKIISRSRRRWKKVAAHLRIFQSSEPPHKLTVRKVVQWLLPRPPRVTVSKSNIRVQIQHVY